MLFTLLTFVFVISHSWLVNSSDRMRVNSSEHTYAIAAHDEKEFLARMRALPPELQYIILEKLYQDEFIPAIGAQGAYVTIKKVPTGAGENEASKLYWRGLKDPYKRLTSPKRGDFDLIFYNKVNLGMRSSKKPCNDILGPNKNRIMVVEENKTINCYDLSQSQPTIKTVQLNLPHYVVETFCCLHPKKNCFAFGKNASNTHSASLDLYTINADHIQQKSNIILDQYLQSLEFNPQELESDTLIGLNDVSLYELDIADLLANQSDSQHVSTPELVEITNVNELVNAAIKNNNLDAGYKDKLLFKNIIFSNKLAGIFIAHLTKQTILLCDRYAQNKIIKVLQYPTEQNDYSLRDLAFCQPRNILKKTIFLGSESYDNVLVLTPKQEFLAKKIKAIADTASTI